MSDQLELGDFLTIVEEVLGIPGAEISMYVAATAESALAAPFATFGGVAFYPEPVERAAICCSRIVRSRPLPGHNKLVGYICMRLMLGRGEFPWPRVKEDALEISEMVHALEAGAISEREFVAWVRARVALGERLRGRPAGESSI